MSALVFMDTETTGLSLDDDVWEFAAVRREPDGSEVEHHLFIQHDVAKCARLPEPFGADHRSRFPISMGSEWHPDATPRDRAARRIAALFLDRPHIVGAVPNFDTERLAMLLDRHGYAARWHYHLIDVENLAVGFLAGRASNGDLDAGLAMPDLPWDSDTLSRAVGVEPPTTERHTAMGDVRWVMALYDAITGGGAS